MMKTFIVKHNILEVDRFVFPGCKTGIFYRPKQWPKIVIEKLEMAEKIAGEVDLTKADAGRAIDALFGAIASELSSGGEVSIAGFGKFETRTRNASTGRNPQTGAEISIPARRVAAFKAAKALKDQVG